MTSTAEQLDALKEMINIGAGRAAGILNDLLHARVNLKVPELKIITVGDFKNEIKKQSDERVATVQLRFKGAFSGKAKLVFPTESASKLIAVVMGNEENSNDLDSVRAGVLMEIGNIVINGVMGSIGNILSQRIIYSTPHYMEEATNYSKNSDDAELDSDTVLVLAQTHFTIKEHKIEGDVALVFDFGSFEILLAAIDNIMPVDSPVT